CRRKVAFEHRDDQPVACAEPEAPRLERRDLLVECGVVAHGGRHDVYHLWNQRPTEVVRKPQASNARCAARFRPWVATVIRARPRRLLQSIALFTSVCPSPRPRSAASTPIKPIEPVSPVAWHVT